MNDKPEHIEPTDRKWAKPTGRPITRADLDQWAMEAERFEPTDDDVINWNEANDYLNEDLGHDE